MNYILSLKKEVAAKDAQIKSFEKSLDEFRAFLNSAKFTGTESNGERKDWISTTDVIKWISETKTNSIIAGETAQN